MVSAWFTLRANLHDLRPINQQTLGSLRLHWQSAHVRAYDLQKSLEEFKIIAKSVLVKRWIKPSLMIVRSSSVMRSFATMAKWIYGF